jgi:4-oxalocrotonate tautomerase
MPYLHLNVSSPLNTQKRAQVATLLTTLTADVLGKKRELTAVAISTTPDQEWFIGAQPISESQQTSFYLDIKVTEGTNTKNEKSSYVDKVFQGMTAILGALAPASYIVIHEVHADSWGYAGQTQEYRYIRGKPL